MTPTHYVFIESRDPFESPDTGFVTSTATELRRRGRPVTIFLVQHGVLATRAAARGAHVAHLRGTGISVLADDFSLAERGIEPAELADGVQASDVGVLVDLLLQPGTKAVWH